MITHSCQLSSESTQTTLSDLGGRFLNTTTKYCTSFLVLLSICHLLLSRAWIQAYAVLSSQSDRLTDSRSNRNSLFTNDVQALTRIKLNDIFFFWLEPDLRMGMSVRHRCYTSGWPKLAETLHSQNFPECISHQMAVMVGIVSQAKGCCSFCCRTVNMSLY